MSGGVRGRRRKPPPTRSSCFSSEGIGDVQLVAQVPEHLLEKSMASSEIKLDTLTIQIRDCSIQVTLNSSLDLLSSVLHVIRHAE